jgi:hypothetical protein
MIVAICSCGERYELKDAVAGRKVRCMACSGPIDVPGSGDEWKALGPRPRNRLAGDSGARAALLAPPSPSPMRRAPGRKAAPATAPSPAPPLDAAIPDAAIALGALIGYAVIFALWVL